MRGLGPFLRDAWHLSRPYFFSEEKWSARGLLAAIVFLNLSLVGMTVILNFWNRAFYNALQDKDWQSFMDLLLFYKRTDTGIMPGFCLIAAVYILVAVYRTYLNQWLRIRWRRWMTQRFLQRWLADRAYYRISLTAAAGANGYGTDNPDQRIADDLNSFVTETLSLSLDLLSNVVTLFSFLTILWTLSGPMTLLGVDIPGYMVWAALIYSAIGTWLTHMVGWPLAALNFRQQRVEADFRFALVRLRENVEGIALHRGEAEEQHGLRGRFEAVILNWWAIMLRTKQLNALVAGYSQAAVIFPIVVAAPRFFSGTMSLGGLTQTADAFGQVQGAMSWFVNSYAALAGWRATVDRLVTFHRSIEAARAAADQGVTAVPGETYALDNATLALPTGQALLDHTSFAFEPGQSVVISGRSGSGKSTLFRALAGIWPFGAGHVRQPRASSLFLPQRPYIPLGTLRHAVAYPAPVDAYSDDEIRAALADAQLSHLEPRLDDEDNWPQRLSGGEQQRLALARALLAKPDWLFLDEATASLDPEAEAALYATLRRRLPGTTLISIAHRPAVAAFHDRHLVFDRPADGPGRLVEAVRSAA
ncbi:ABC transporter ATP-binding protein/permease [Limobrevibacterium gyesilva]|uniref:ABC transporter ATP-binding protein/permease n=1 Tax=Limobrevibacterium gyesilva TaxID=2991712 RepID=A0AA41YKW3_9PROT|nr:ABC transporter ATP-binding protein/permease [Limobrevibacterium gyesilva]MCW3475724.1 ABC transporter ATP-binding protein/permease [Limobrevibacterium gyesilva]